MKDLIRGLHQILTTTIAQERFYFARMQGFRNELELRKYLVDKKIDILDSGMFLFGKSEVFQNELIYITLSRDDKNNYLDFYKNVSKIPIVKKQFFISIGTSDKWELGNFEVAGGKKTESIKILYPDCNVFEYKDNSFIESKLESLEGLFNKKSVVSFAKQKENRIEYFSDYNKDDIESIYANRFLLDVVLRGYKKGMIDFDAIVKKNETYYLLESKEKDPITQTDGKKLFGWDSRRIAWYLFLQVCAGLRTFYVIREVDNQQDRNFVAWKYASIEDFCISASWLAETAGTITAHYSAFKSLDEIIFSDAK